MSFSALKQNRANDIQSLVSAAESIGGGGEKKSYADERFWKPTVDKAGNGYAVLRFLPAPAGEELPWVRYWDHGFKGPTGLWYIENSLTSIGQPDPVGEMNSVLWNSGRDEDKAIARDRKRRLHYVVNVMVVSDPSNPNNEGKVFLYKFGKKIFDKIMDVMQPQFQDEKPVNPFDFWEGADFKLKIRKVDGYWNYDKSEFDSPASLLDDDDALEAIWKQEHSLAEFTAPTSFKSYEDLERRLNQVLRVKQQRPMVQDESFEDESEGRGGFNDADITLSSAKKASAPVESKDEDEDDALSYFQKLAEA